MEKEKQLLLLCRQLIEQSLNWGDSSVWNNDDFDQLSEKIFDKTRVQLSVSTLKRIWGKVRYENFPTAGTLNALAGFLDYDSWRDFRQKNEIDHIPAIPVNEVKPLPGAEPFLPQNTPPNKKQISPKAIAVAWLFTGLLIISVIIFLIWQKPVNPSKIKFEAIKVSDNLPNSVVFNYDASAFKSDSVFIQQSWDPTRRERVDGNGKQYTSIYYYPGFFVAKLVVDHKIKKQCAIFIKTKGWKGIIERLPVPVYLSANEMKSRSYMGITDSTFRKKTGLPVFNSTWVDFTNVREFIDIDAGNFTFETTLRNASAIEASDCRQIRVILLGTSTAIIINLADKGCTSAINLETGDTWVGGRDHDMSAFGCDFNRFQNLKCNVEYHRLKIYLNDKLIWNSPQKQTLDEIVGIRYEFEGAAEIRDVKLATPGKGNYSERF
jgi:hypothetical protein